MAFDKSPDSLFRDSDARDDFERAISILFREFEAAVCQFGGCGDECAILLLATLRLMMVVPHPLPGAELRVMCLDCGPEAVPHDFIGRYINALPKLRETFAQSLGSAD